MDNEKLSSNIGQATKWSSITEIIAKFVVPISNMILARLLTPEAFGVVATVNMVITFADLFTDAGFQKYLIQQPFNNSTEKYQYVNVAFWTNLFISAILWGVICFFSNSIARMVGSPGLGIVICVASFTLFLTSFSSIQMALYQRSFDFKTLFTVRIGSIFIPLIITVPLAYLGFSYWSIIIGTICANLWNAIVLTIKSEWKPKLYYSFNILKTMLSFCMWSLAESITIWLTNWADTFIIGTKLSTEQLGLYKNSTANVNGIMGIVSTAMTPVMISGLAKVQKNKEKFDGLFFQFHKFLSMFLVPLAAGVFIYRDLITRIILGSQWSSASLIVGIWGASTAIMILFSHTCSAAYVAVGKPKLSFFTQVSHLFFLIPACLISINYGFWTLILTRTIVRFQLAIANLMALKYSMKMNISNMFINLFKPIIASIPMVVFGLFVLKNVNSFFIQILSIFVCIAIYFFMMFIVDRKNMQSLISYLKREKNA